MNSQINWSTRVDILKFAFQPIVSTRTGLCLGYEALLRHWEEAGFTSIKDVFDQAYKENYLYKLDLQLREKVIQNFSKLKGNNNLQLFFNLDNRVLEMPDYKIGNTTALLANYNLPSSALCFEISEQHDLTDKESWLVPLHKYQGQNFQVAIDDYGTGFAGMKLFYQAEPNFVKIDRFFISNIESDNKKKLFVTKLVELAHSLGISIIAEGVETIQEFYICRSIGCDFVQGYFIQKPTLSYPDLRLKYDHIDDLIQKDKRRYSDDQWMISEQMIKLPAIPQKMDMLEVIEIFRKNKQNSFFPVVDENSTPVGMIHENELKEFVYSLYGKDLLQNRSSGKILKDFICSTPVADVTSKVEDIIKIFSLNQEVEGILVTRDTTYIGFLTARSLLNILNAKNLATARDQNPLTRLPGNQLIMEYVERAVQKESCQYSLIYFDLDQFKPFNDYFGFREGDRAIQLFADLLRKYFPQSSEFIGHIGGDDFFVGIQNLEFHLTYQKVNEIVKNFASSVESLYSPVDREQGYIETLNREGILQKIPLLTVSAVVLHLKKNHHSLSPGLISEVLAGMKKGAKASSDKICSASIAS